MPVRVLHPGRRGRGPGPDFRGALVAAPSGGVLRGDVELHVRATDFHAHGHHKDHRYDGLVLHVVFEDDSGEDTALASGRRVPVVVLSSWARLRARELAEWLAGPALWREPCADAVARLGRDAVLRTLEALGDRRFAEREATLAAEAALRGAGEALYRALLAGLGYGGDRQLLETLAERLPWGELSARLAASPAAERVAAAEALLLGAGLLPSQGAGQATSLRPANHPARRLAGLARLVVRHRAVLDGTASVEGLLEASAASLIRAWTVPAAGCWRQVLAPGLPAKRPPGALIGRGRAIELLVNAVLPWAAALAEARGRPDVAERARIRFTELPRPGRYGALVFLEAHLASGGKPLPLDARRQQGLLALYKTECTQGGCGRCVFS